MSRSWRRRHFARLAFCLLAFCLLAAGLLVWRQWLRAPLERAEKAVAAREYVVAREQLALYLARRPRDARAHLLAARAARHLREYHEAFEHLRACRELGGHAEAAEIELALIAVQRGGEPPPTLRQRGEADDETALVVLEVLIQHDLDHYRLRQALHGLGRYLERRPGDLQALLARAYVWERFLYFADALEDYRKAVDTHPDSDLARLKLAETLLITGTPGEAMEHFERLAERQPDRAEVQLGLARCQRRLGQSEQARRLLAALVTAGHEGGEFLWERGLVELDEGKPAAAEPWLRRAALASPHDRRIAYSLGRCLLALGKKEESEKVNARVAEIDADLKRLDQVRQQVMARPGDAALRCEGGLLFLRNGERQEGIKWLRLALRLDPACREAREALERAGVPQEMQPR